MKIAQTNELTPEWKGFIADVWNSEYPQRLAFTEHETLDQYLYRLKNPVYFIAEDEHRHPLAWAATFERENERWFTLIIQRGSQRRGLGSMLLKTLKERERVLNGWVIDNNSEPKADGSLYVSPMAFYLKNEFVVCKEQRLETHKLSAVKIKWNSEQNV